MGWSCVLACAKAADDQSTKWKMALIIVDEFLLGSRHQRESGASVRRKGEAGDDTKKWLTGGSVVPGGGAGAQVRTKVGQMPATTW